jgi:hypothetical protein
MVSVGKILSLSMVVDQPQGKVHVSCQYLQCGDNLSWFKI